MHTLYKIITGPLMWLTFILFFGGILYRVWEIGWLVQRKEKSLLSYMSLKYSLRSLAHWLTPFGSLNMRRHPVMTIVSYAFHLCVLLVPIFLLAHIVLWEEAWGISWWALPDSLADVLTLVVAAACIFFAVRRLLRPEVRYITTNTDYLFLAVVVLPFISGFYCSQGWPGYPAALIIHMLSGQVMLAMIPFSRLSHMIVLWFTRSYMGSEFGLVRHARDY